MVKEGAHTPLLLFFKFALWGAWGNRNERAECFH